LRQIYRSLTLLDLARRRTRLKTYNPYPKQKEFHALSATCRERLLLGANQSGKTLGGAAEVAIHLTGLYPAWWTGLRWRRPIRAWAGSETSEVTRDGVQRLLVGEPKDESQWGTGMIPHAQLADMTRRPGLVGALDGVIVKHVSGGNSVLGFKTYDQGRQRWQGETLDLVWFDEEPPQDVYVEGMTRTNATEGMGFITATPLLGMSEVIYSFVNEVGMG
jgi:phage terminase large subunit-like protein